MKNLKPSMRENKRYLLIKGNNLRENIEKAILDFIGILGMSKAGLEFIETKEGSAIIGVNRESLNHVRASICAFPEKMEVIRVSGTLRSLREK